MKKQYKKIEIMMNHAFKTEDNKGVITGNLVALDYGYVEEIFDATFSFAKNVIIEEFMPMFTEKYGITTEEELYAYVSDENNRDSEVTDTMFGLLKTLQGNLMMAINEAVGTTYQLAEFASPKVLH